MVEIIARGTSVGIAVAIWAAAYLVLGVVLWLALEKGGSAPLHTSWRRPVIGWLFTQIAVGVLAWILLQGGVIKMV